MSPGPVNRVDQESRVWQGLEQHMLALEADMQKRDLVHHTGSSEWLDDLVRRYSAMPQLRV